MSLHLSGLFFFGITPKGLSCRSGGDSDDAGDRRVMRPSSTSRAKYAEMTSGLS